MNYQVRLVCNGCVSCVLRIIRITKNTFTNTYYLDWLGKYFVLKLSFYAWTMRPRVTPVLIQQLLISIDLNNMRKQNKYAVHAGVTCYIVTFCTLETDVIFSKHSIFTILIVGGAHPYL